MDKKSFIEKVSKRICYGKCELFVGSGISIDSHIPSWENVLSPLAKQIGINIERQSDLPLVAQYIINENSGNRNIINDRLVKCFEKDYDINDYHKCLANINVDTIWTTNYDLLLEKCFNNRKYRVIKNDADAVKINNDNSLEIIKIHGSIDGNLSDIVLTKQDYDRFLFEKKVLSQKLRNSLLHKTIFFIGYGYRDDDIRNIMIQAMEIANQSTQIHYMLILDEQKSKSKLRKTSNIKNEKELWYQELKRLGIITCVVNSKKEYLEVIKKIVGMSKGKTVYITGSHEKISRKKTKMLKSYGKKLASKTKICLINGQSQGVGAIVNEAFGSKCIQKKYDINYRSRTFSNPYAINPKFKNRKDLIPLLKKERVALFANTRLIVFFLGGMGSEAEYELASEMGCEILIGILHKDDYKNELIKELLADKKIMNNIKKKSKKYYRYLIHKKVPDSKLLFSATKDMYK